MVFCYNNYITQHDTSKGVFKKTNNFHKYFLITGHIIIKVKGTKKSLSETVIYIKENKTIIFTYERTYMLINLFAITTTNIMPVVY